MADHSSGAALSTLKAALYQLQIAAHQATRVGDPIQAQKHTDTANEVQAVILSLETQRSKHDATSQRINISRSDLIDWANEVDQLGEMLKSTNKIRGEQLISLAARIAGSKIAFDLLRRAHNELIVDREANQEDRASAEQTLKEIADYVLRNAPPEGYRTIQDIILEHEKDPHRKALLEAARERLKVHATSGIYRWTEDASRLLREWLKVAPTEPRNEMLKLVNESHELLSGVPSNTTAAQVTPSAATSKTPRTDALCKRLQGDPPVSLTENDAEELAQHARQLERELAEARQIFDEHIAKVNAKLTDIEETLKPAPSAMEGTVQMNRDLVIAVRSYVQAKRDKQSAMGLNYGATDLLLSRIDAAMASSDRTGAGQ